MNSRRKLAIAATSLWMALSVAPACATFSPVIDEFWIVKNGAELFRDSFNGGGLPPDGPDGAATYSVTGDAGFASESGGKLTMIPGFGTPTIVSGAPADYATNATRAASTNPANNSFLGQASSFSIHGLFDTTNLPTVSGQSFGIRATDRATGLGNQGNETYLLFVGLGEEGGTNAGNVVVSLRKNDFVAGNSSVLATVSIENQLPQLSQIELTFSKAAGASVLNAAYRLYGATGNQLAFDSIGANRTLSIYSGEDFIRGGFQSSDIVPVPEPSSLAMLIAGLGGLVGLRKLHARGSQGRRCGRA